MEGETKEEKSKANENSSNSKFAAEKAIIEEKAEIAIHSFFFIRNVCSG